MGSVDVKHHVYLLTYLQTLGAYTALAVGLEMYPPSRDATMHHSMVPDSVSFCRNIPYVSCSSTLAHAVWRFVQLVLVPN